MRVLSSLLTALLIAVALSTLSAPPSDAGDAAAVEAAQPADAGGCPGAANGAPCCATCQDRQAKVEGEAAAAPKPCPCQERAKRLREAAERAKQD